MLYLFQHTRTVKYIPSSTDKEMVLTNKQAMLLAMEVFVQFIRFALKTPTAPKLLTPLAGACFSKEDIPGLAKELNLAEGEVLGHINCSTCAEGQYLSYGDCNFAAVAALNAVRNLKDEAIKRSIVTKVIRQYSEMGKTPDMNKIKIICKYDTGGVLWGTTLKRS